MSSAWSSELSYQSESSVASEIDFVDFLPECIDPGGICSNPTFENFQTMIDQANEWLRRNPQWEVRTCESVEFKVNNRQVNPEKTYYLELGKGELRQLRGLRLWLRTRKSREEKPQQIGYINLIPECVQQGGVFSSSKFETLDQIVTRFNETIRSRPLPGRIITIESQEIKMKNSVEVQPDKSYWVEYGRVNLRYLFIIRIFYEVSEEVPREEIGFADFAPDNVKEGGIFSYPKYEPLSNIVKKASDWCIRHPDIRICNMKALEIKMKRGNEADSNKMYYVEEGRRFVCYLRIIRVAYTKYRTPEEDTIREITSKIFSPVQLKSTLTSVEFESLTETKNRIKAWLKITGAQLICAETAAIRLYTGGERKLGPEASFTYEPGERNEHYIYVFKLYFNGGCQEPPLELLPPVPELEEQHCCIAS